jgi:F-box/WD-40 domain protein 7
VLSFLEPRDLLRAAQTCRYWRLLAEDNLLWREKCRAAGIEDVSGHHRRKHRASASSSTPPINLCTNPNKTSSDTGSSSQNNFSPSHNNGANQQPVPSPWKVCVLILNYFI